MAHEKEPQAERVLIAMSGGVDSSVAAALLKTQGYEVIGVHMQLWDDSAAEFKNTGGSCCSIVDANDARKVADQLGIPFYVINARDQFQNDVVDYFVHEYLQARTPNPCVMCNNKLKFSYLVKKADELRCTWVATGHYAKVVRSIDSGETLLYKAADLTKDQSYFLFGLKQEQLKRVLMPLGDLTKEYVRKLATTFGLQVADKKDSQEICFIDETGYKPFIEKRVPDHYRTAGQILTKEGRILGRHQGLFRYTIGQKKGLGLEGPDTQNLYVIDVDIATNSLIVGPESGLYKLGLLASGCNWIGTLSFVNGVRAFAKIRSRHQEAECMITLLNNNCVAVQFLKPQRAITPGQAIVFYIENQMIGGGWIERFIEPQQSTQSRPQKAATT